MGERDDFAKKLWMPISEHERFVKQLEAIVSRLVASIDQLKEAKDEGDRLRATDQIQLDLVRQFQLDLAGSMERPKLVLQELIRRLKELDLHRWSDNG